MSGELLFVLLLCVSCVGYWLSRFFFQAEDGIRDAQESRGLGDVYKRQVPALEDADMALTPSTMLSLGTPAPAFELPDTSGTVSYTHLTLPTIYSV